MITFPSSEFSELIVFIIQNPLKTFNHYLKFIKFIRRYLLAVVPVFLIKVNNFFVAFTLYIHSFCPFTDSFAVISSKFFFSQPLLKSIILLSDSAVRLRYTLSSFFFRYIICHSCFVGLHRSIFFYRQASFSKVHKKKNSDTSSCQYK